MRGWKAPMEPGIGVALGLRVRWYGTHLAGYFFNFALSGPTMV